MLSGMLFSSSNIETEAETKMESTSLSLRAQAINFYQETIKRKLPDDPERRGSNTTHTSSSLDCEPLDGADHEAHSLQLAPTISLSFTNSYEGYTLGDHEEYLSIRTEKNGCRYCDVSHYLGVQSSVPNLVKDYISPLSQHQLKELYAGIVPSMDDTLDKEPLPVRTLCFRIRPDIESGVVMDAVQSVFEGDQNTIKSIVLKRQGGHYQCAVAHAVTHDSAPFFIDAQLCTTKSDNMERQLVVRIHHVQDNAEALMEVGHMITERQATEEESPSFAINLHLKEVSSILQLISSAQKRNADVDAYSCLSPQPTPKETSLFLQENYQAEKSLNTGDGTTEHFPALSSEDFFILQSSLPHCLLLWKLIGHHESNCAFHTLIDVHMGTCLDVLYLSQIRQFSRDTMLEELRKSKTEIDESAQRAEDEYSNFAELLETTFKHHSIDIPETIPPKVSVTKFPSSKCPPGFSIAAAMASNDVEVDPANPVAAADEVAQKVYAAFSSIDDKEQKRYLKKINEEATARCAEIQYQKLIGHIEEPKLPSVVAAAKGFCNFARQASNHKGRVERVLTSKVPLLDFKTSAGPCLITSTRILVVGEGVFSRTFLFDLRAVDFEVTSLGFLQVVSDANGEVLHKFRSSIDASKVKMFLDTLKSQWRPREGHT